jgi:hypothetical protein
MAAPRKMGAVLVFDFLATKQPSPQFIRHVGWQPSVRRTLFAEAGDSQAAQLGKGERRQIGNCFPVTFVDPPEKDRHFPGSRCGRWSHELSILYKTPKVANATPCRQNDNENAIRKETIPCELPIESSSLPANPDVPVSRKFLLEATRSPSPNSSVVQAH